MDKETSDTMNLDLNLGPGPEAESELEAPNDAVNLDDWVDDPIVRIREAVRFRARQHRRWRQFQLPLQSQSLSVELNQLMGNPGHVGKLQAGEGSVAAEERTNEGPNDAVNLDDWDDDPIVRIREAVRFRARQRRRWRQSQLPLQSQSLSVELNQLMVNPGHVGTLQAGEGSVAAEERTNEAPKLCENNNVFLEDEVSEKKDDVEKTSGIDGSFFDCNICLDLATDPVVT